MLVLGIVILGIIFVNVPNNYYARNNDVHVTA